MKKSILILISILSLLSTACKKKDNPQPETIKPIPIHTINVISRNGQWGGPILYLNGNVIISDTMPGGYQKEIQIFQGDLVVIIDNGSDYFVGNQLMQGNIDCSIFVDNMLVDSKFCICNLYYKQQF